MTQEDVMVSYLETQYIEMFERKVDINDNWDLFPEEWWTLESEKKITILKEALANHISIVDTKAFSQTQSNSR